MDKAPEVTVQEIDDTKLVAGLQAGDPAYHRLLSDKYRSRIFSFLLKSGSSREDAAEIMNDVFYHVIVEIDKYDPSKSAFLTWLFNQAKYQRLKLTRQQDKIASSAMGLPRNSLQSAESKERCNLLDNYMSELPENTRMILELRYLGSMDAKEIAQILDVKHDTVRQILSRIRKKLHQDLSRHACFDDWVS